MKTVVIGIVGTKLDRGAGKRRWDTWRPSVDLCRHDDLVIDRFDLLASREGMEIADRVAADVRQVSPETELKVHPLGFPDPWDFEAVYAELHDFARRYPFKPQKERYLIHMTTGSHVMQICLFLLCESRHLPGKLLQTSPPTAKNRGQPGTYSIIDLDLSQYDQIARRAKEAQREATDVLKSGIRTRNPAFNALMGRIEQVAGNTRAPLLLTGPTGAGKSQLARRIYELKASRRQVDGPFVEVNCATLRGDGAAAALFGHVKGAFTGAVQARPGLLRTAHGGVLFLDEIGELGLDEQAMLLRAVEDRTFHPLGSDRPAESDFQLIAGTNRDLQLAVEEGRFREDLLARIDLWTFRLPALAERPEDLEPNLEHELEVASRELGRRVSFNSEARTRFMTFATSPRALWTRNFRDFKAAVSRLSTLAPGGRITAALVEDEIARLESTWGTRLNVQVRGTHARSTGRNVLRSDATPGSPPHRLDVQEEGDDIRLRALLGEAADALDPFDRVQLAHVLGVCQRASSLADAGRALFAVSRTKKATRNDSHRLRQYLQRFGLQWAQVRGAGAHA
ncbi:MAG TPA: RNA repair transcriptional activator RtcR [Myxococcaceae bacterium]|nr:RNA repair transcriptional activator RtcR [Myxococcaceae bacterium]